MSNISPMYLTDVFGPLCEGLNTLIFYDKYFYILDLKSKMSVTRDGLNLEKVTYLSPKVVYTNDVICHNTHNLLTKHEKTFKYEDLFSLIRDNYGDGILHNGVITNCIYYPETILDKLNIYLAEFAKYGDINTVTNKLTAIFNKVKIDHKVEEYGLYVFAHEENFCYISPEKVTRVLESLNSIKRKYKYVGE